MMMPKRKTTVNAMLRAKVKSGEIQQMPCEVCQNPTSEAHHDDYSKPYEVRWLCSIHHWAVTEVQLSEGTNFLPIRPVEPCNERHEHTFDCLSREQQQVAAAALAGAKGLPRIDLGFSHFVHAAHLAAAHRRLGFRELRQLVAFTDREMERQRIAAGQPRQVFVNGRIKLLEPEEKF